MMLRRGVKKNRHGVTGQIFHEMMLRHGVKQIFGYPGGAVSCYHPYAQNQADLF